MRGEKSLFSGQEICPRGRRKEDQTPSADQSPPPSLLPNSEKGSFPLITPFLSPRRSEAGTTTTTRFILGVEGREYAEPTTWLSSPAPYFHSSPFFPPSWWDFLPLLPPLTSFPLSRTERRRRRGKGEKEPPFLPLFSPALESSPSSSSPALFCVLRASSSSPSPRCFLPRGKKG